MHPKELESCFWRGAPQTEVQPRARSCSVLWSPLPKPFDGAAEQSWAETPQFCSSAPPAALQTPSSCPLLLLGPTSAVRKWWLWLRKSRARDQTAEISSCPKDGSKPGQSWGLEEQLLSESEFAGVGPSCFSPWQLPMAEERLQGSGDVLLSCGKSLCVSPSALALCPALESRFALIHARSASPWAGKRQGYGPHAPLVAWPSEWALGPAGLLPATGRGSPLSRTSPMPGRS